MCVVCWDRGLDLCSHFFLMGGEGLGGDDGSEDSVAYLPSKGKVSEVFYSSALALHIKVAFVVCFVFHRDNPLRWPFGQILA